MHRCPWVGKNKAELVEYHDKDWGVPVHEDRKLFEMLVLEGAQAGLNWETILKRREAYRHVFKQFDPLQVANLTDAYLESLLTSKSGIIRNRLKVFSARQNAHIFLQVQQEFGSFASYLWGFVQHTPQINRPESIHGIPTQSKESLLLSKDLKHRGMRFVGPTIMYAYMQAVGMVDDHIQGCFRCTLL